MEKINTVWNLILQVVLFIPHFQRGWFCYLIRDFFPSNFWVASFKKPSNQTQQVSQQKVKLRANEAKKAETQGFFSIKTLAPFPLKIGSLCLQKWVGYLFLYNVWLSNWSLKQFLATKCNKFVVLAIIKSIFFNCKGKWMWRRCCYEFLISIWGKNDHIHH